MKSTIDWVEAPGVNTSATPRRFSSGMSSAGIVPPTVTITSSMPCLPGRLRPGKRLGKFHLPEGDTISEPVFVERGKDAAEGDGWLLTVVYRARENRSDLAVFNGTDVEAGPIALVHLAHRVPDGFHGNWVGAA